MRKDNPQIVRPFLFRRWYFTKNIIYKPLWVILSSILLFLISCATLPKEQPYPYTPEEGVKANLGTIGIVSAGFQPEVRFQKPMTKGKASLHGAGAGAVGVLSLGCTGYGCIGILALAPVGAAVGSIVGTIKGVPLHKIRETEDTLNNYLTAVNFQETMREHFLKTAREQTQYPFLLLEVPGPNVMDEEITYGSLSDKGIDTILEMTVRKCDLQGIKHGINRSLPLVMAVGIRLIQVKDSYVLCNLLYEYKSDPRNFLEWGANDAQLFREELDRAFQYFATEIVRALSNIRTPPNLQSPNVMNIN